jgi:putative PIN family toxin of toxin-antitoxin system
MIKAVLDTNVLVSGLLSYYGIPAQVINHLRAGRFQLFYDDEILAEYFEVLTRDKFKLNLFDVNDLLDHIKRVGTSMFAPVSQIPLPDDDDRIFYDMAQCAGAYVVTGNMRHFPAEPFIITPSQFLELIKAETWE